MLFAPCVKIAGAVASAAHAIGVPDALLEDAGPQGGAGAFARGKPCKKSCERLIATPVRPTSVVQAAPERTWTLPPGATGEHVGRRDAAQHSRGPPERVAWVTYRDVHAVTSRLLN
jgi:hypothetical protein